ncbi:hypothetical protein GKQ23_10750 [Erwinia sp. E602]|uniref:hypothetical protein n=1 Tax=Erwinia sp. E602 TaxID=2675378 RepID=UPI001BA84747|nr:hypothetical protein [Erwinia sp. E602]QUG75434.1 hypothetical protein GKQ23_10750 [Erwinia sp. E602]
MKLTKSEKAWVAKVNKLLAECPSDRLTFYAMGDHGIYIVDGGITDQIDASRDDPLRVAQRLDGLAAEQIQFPSNVSAVCG